MSGRVFRVYAFKLCLSLVTLKPNRFPNRAEVSRLFDRFKEPSTFLEAGRRWIRKKSSEHAPLLRNSCGEYHDGGAGTSI